MNTQEKKSIALAWGFKKAFDQLKSRDARYELRRLLTKYFFFLHWEKTFLRKEYSFLCV